MYIIYVDNNKLQERQDERSDKFYFDWHNNAFYNHDLLLYSISWRFKYSSLVFEAVDILVIPALLEWLGPYVLGIRILRFFELY